MCPHGPTMLNKQHYKNEKLETFMPISQNHTSRQPAFSRFVIQEEKDLVLWYQIKTESLLHTMIPKLTSPKMSP